MQQYNFIIDNKEYNSINLMYKTHRNTINLIKNYMNIDYKLFYNNTTIYMKNVI